MSDDYLASNSRSYICFLLHQLRDHVAELIGRLESGDVSHNQLTLVKEELQRALTAVSEYDPERKSSR